MLQEFAALNGVLAKTGFSDFEDELIHTCL